MNIWDHLKAWIHRKTAESFTTDSLGNTAVNTKSEVTFGGSDVLLDAFGNLSISETHNQVEVPLDDPTWADFVTPTTANGGNGTQSGGQVTLATSTDANGRYALISKDLIEYRPNSEIGAGFTWSIPTASVANSKVRIGLTSDITNWDDSIYIGHEGGQLVLVYRNNGTTIFSLTQNQWYDPCDGSTGSNYIDRNNNPVALDSTKDQLMRVRCGLFGHAGIVIELKAPKQRKWVTIYEYTGINLDNVPLFSSFDLYIGAEVVKTGADATDIKLSSACWGGWTGSTKQRLNSTISDRTLAEVNRSVIEGKSTAGGGTYVPVKVDPSGALQTTANQDTHDSLNANVNLQIADVDVSATNPVLTKAVDGSGNEILYDSDLAIARGRYGTVSHTNKFGRAPDGIQTTDTDVWDRADATPTQQIWLAPTQARVHTIVSSSAADDGTPEGAGAGAQAVRIWGLQTWSSAESSEDVTLNGTTGVNTANSYVIIHRIKVIELGSTYAINTGIITATAVTDGTVTAQINAGNGSTEMAIYGIPSGKTGYITNYDVGANNAGNPTTVLETSFKMLVNERPDLSTTTFINKANRSLIASGSSSEIRVYNPYLKIVGPAIIKFQAVASLADTNATAEFDIIIV